MKILEKARKKIHDLLDWGYPDKWEDIGGHMTCKFCEYHVTQDSTGAWFHLWSKWK